MTQDREGRGPERAPQGKVEPQGDPVQAGLKNHGVRTLSKAKGTGLRAFAGSDHRGSREVLIRERKKNPVVNALIVRKQNKLLLRECFEVDLHLVHLS